VNVGDNVRVVMATDETLPEEYVGRLGRLIEVLPYQEIGDKPPEDPLFLVAHAPSYGRKYERQIYWREEIATDG
jgi:hypothetical protein